MLLEEETVNYKRTEDRNCLKQRHPGCMVRVGLWGEGGRTLLYRGSGNLGNIYGRVLTPTKVGKLASWKLQKAGFCKISLDCAPQEPPCYWAWRLVGLRLRSDWMWWRKCRYSSVTWRHEGRGTPAAQSSVPRWRRGLTGAESAPSGHQLTQLTLELASKQAVDDEVWRRVDGDDEITDVIESHVQRAG